MDAINTALGGMMNAVDRFDKAAGQLSHASQLSDQDLDDAVTGAHDAEIDFRANVAVLRTADRMMGTLLDMVA
jgi:hypothetical protein